MEKLLERLKAEIVLKGYSQRTIKAYVSCVRAYLISVEGELDIDNVRAYLLGLHDMGKAGQTINLHLNAIKFFYKEVLRSKRSIQLKFAKKSNSLPVVLNRDEIDELLKSVKNRKHKAILALAYSSGLRVSELTKLKVGDLNFDEGLIHIKNGKGNKDRFTVLSKEIGLEVFCENKDAGDYLFESSRGGALTSRTLQKIFKQACARVNIKKSLTFHSLRHSFATHLIEKGVNLRYVQELLGHTNIKTTQRYTQVAVNHLKNIESLL